MAMAMSAANVVAKRLPKIFDARTHAVMDYLTAGAFLVMASLFWTGNKRAAIGAAMCGGAIVATSMLTDYPGGVKRVISFPTHGRIDTGLAGLAAGMPNVMAFNDEDEAKYFRGAALVETVITGLTDFDSATGGNVVEMHTRTA
jgi:hypothetical protein